MSPGLVSGNIFDCHNWGWGAVGIKWTEAREAAKPPKMHRTAPVTKNYLASNVSNAEAEKRCIKDYTLALLVPGRVVGISIVKMGKWHLCRLE